MTRAFILPAIAAAALAMAGCSTDSGLLGSTGTIPKAAPVAAKPVASPACMALASQIETLRKDGLVERVEAASKGKTKTVSVKRESLGKIAELEKANAEFQAKCSTLPRTAAVAKPAAAQVNVANAAAKTAATQKAATAATKAAAPVKAATTAAVKPVVATPSQ